MKTDRPDWLMIVGPVLIVAILYGAGSALPSLQGSGNSLREQPALPQTIEGARRNEEAESNAMAAELIAVTDTDSARIRALPPLSRNPVLRVSQKARRGDFGKLTPWQQTGYTLAIERGATVTGIAKVTSFYPAEGYDEGEATAYGYGCSDSTVAANALPAHSFVLIELPTGWELRRVEDTGASWNDPVARRQGTDLWLDRWVRKPVGTMHCRYAVIGGQ